MNLDIAVKQLIEDDFLQQIKDSDLSSYEPMIIELVQFFENNNHKISDTCNMCGCSEFLCGHNERK